MEHLFYRYYNCLYYLEGRCIFKKILDVPVSHLPTLMLVIGYPLFWLEMYFVRRGYGQTTVLAPTLFFLVSIYILGSQRKNIRSSFRRNWYQFKQLSFFSKFLISIGSLLGIFILLCAFYASLFPPHLIQEFDVLNYHIPLPRQHLILGSFQHIPWSTADLFLLPLDFALAPFWLCTEFPNKFPQYVFLIGLILIAVRLAGRFSDGNLAAKIMIGLAIVGSHNVGIQMGTAMLDVVMCYLFLAALESFLSGHVFLGAVELTFYLWSKAFIPLQTILIIFCMIVLYFILKKIGFRKIGWIQGNVWNEDDKKEVMIKLKKITVFFLLISVFIAGPFLIKSFYYSGTPLYPFFLEVLPSRSNDVGNQEVPSKQLLIEKAGELIETKDAYGHGRSFWAFIRHFWLIAVPEKGVNNSYDYPVGLMYLLCLGPFAYSVLESINKKQFLILPIFIVVFWSSWWFGAHQSRFLFVPIIFMYIVVLTQKKFQTNIFLLCMVLSLGLVFLSVFRTHKNDFGKTHYQVLRERDRKLLTFSDQMESKEPIVLDYADVAFARFPVNVKGVESVFVINY